MPACAGMNGRGRWIRKNPAGWRGFLLAFAELEAAAGFGFAVFFAFDDAGVAGEEAGDF